MRIRSGSHDQLGSGTSGTARVIAQIVYDAYGRVIGRDDPATPSTGPPELRVGHKGLFFDRLDSGIADPLTGFETPRLWPGARLGGYVRNRTLHCDFQRWNQPDPNATGLVVQGAVTYHGSKIKRKQQAINIITHYGDGANTYIYVRSSPYSHQDPVGLMADFTSLGQLATQKITKTLGKFNAPAAAAKAAWGGIQGGVTGGIGGWWNAAVQNKDIAAGIVGGFISGALTGAATGGLGGFDKAGAIHFVLGGATVGAASSGGVSYYQGNRGWSLVVDMVAGTMGGGAGGALAGSGDDIFELFFSLGWGYFDTWRGLARNNGWLP